MRPLPMVLMPVAGYLCEWIYLHHPLEGGVPGSRECTASSTCMRLSDIQKRSMLTLRIYHSLVRRLASPRRTSRRSRPPRTTALTIERSTGSRSRASSRLSRRGRRSRRLGRGHQSSARLGGSRWRSRSRSRRRGGRCRNTGTAESLHSRARDLVSAQAVVDVDLNAWVGWCVESLRRGTVDGLAAGAADHEVDALDVVLRAAC